ncbi:MAG: hypothetical protein WAN05_22910 [Roseiarcus sp.]
MTVNLNNGIGHITLGGGNDTVNANGNGTTITAGGGNDMVTANGNGDTISLGGGNNTVTANGGADKFTFGNGGGRCVVWPPPGPRAGLPRTRDRIGCGDFLVPTGTQFGASFSP